MAASWVVFAFALGACGSNLGSSTTLESTPASTVDGGTGQSDACADTVAKTIAGFGDMFDQIDTDPARADDVLSSVEMDNLFMSLGQPLETICGSEAAIDGYSEVLVFLSDEVSLRPDGAGPHIGELITAFCEADIFELTAEAISACSTG